MASGQVASGFLSATMGDFSPSVYVRPTVTSAVFRVSIEYAQIEVSGQVKGGQSETVIVIFGLLRLSTPK